MQKTFARRGALMAAYLAALTIVVILAIGAGLLSVSPLFAQHSNPWLLEWIPAKCCVTNDCCREVTASEMKPLPDDRWRIVASGQVLKRTDWSPDGKYYRCFCDQVEGKWVVFPTAFTRCIYVPMQSM